MCAQSRMRRMVKVIFYVLLVLSQLTSRSSCRTRNVLQRRRQKWRTSSHRSGCSQMIRPCLNVFLFVQFVQIVTIWWNNLGFRNTGHHNDPLNMHMFSICTIFFLKKLCNITVEKCHFHDCCGSLCSSDGQLHSAGVDRPVCEVQCEVSSHRKWPHASNLLQSDVPDLHWPGRKHARVSCSNKQVHYLIQIICVYSILQIYISLRLYFQVPCSFRAEFSA